MSTKCGLHFKCPLSYNYRYSCSFSFFSLAGPLSDVLTAVGSEVALPCDLMPGTQIADKVQLVIWYRQGNVKPIYT